MEKQTERQPLTKAQIARISKDYARMYIALRRIAAYQSPEKLHRFSQKDWGLPVGWKKTCIAIDAALANAEKLRAAK